MYSAVSQRSAPLRAEDANHDSTATNGNVVVVSGEASEEEEDDTEIGELTMDSQPPVTPVPERTTGRSTKLHKIAEVPVWTVTLVRPRKDGLTLPALGIRLSHNHPRGVKIAAVIEDSPASANFASIAAGDIVVEVNGKYMLDTSYFDLTTTIATAGAQPGAKVVLTLARSWDIAEQFKKKTAPRINPEEDIAGDVGNADGAVASLAPQLGTATSPFLAARASGAAVGTKIKTEDVKRTVTIERAAGGGIGMRIVAAGVLPRGARVAAVTPASPAAEGGLRADDVIMDVNGQSVINLALKQVENAVQAAGARIVLGVVASEHFTSGACQLVTIPRADERMLFDEYEEAMWETEMENVTEIATNITTATPSADGGGEIPPGVARASSGEGGTIATGIRAAWGAFRKSIKEAKEQYSLRTASNKALYPSIEQSIDPESVSLASPINYASKPSPPVSPTMENENSLKTLVRTASGAGIELMRGTARTLKDAAVTEFKEKVLKDTYKEGDVILEGSWEPARLALTEEESSAIASTTSNTQDDDSKPEGTEGDRSPYIQMETIDGKS